MNTATLPLQTETSRPTPSRKPRPFSLPCPLCGAMEGLTVRTHDLEIACVECGADISRADLQEMVSEIQRLLAWIDAAR
mgnify:CR=1 FL=1